MLDSRSDRGGASRRAGGRDERPPNFSTQSVTDSTASRRWIPPSIVKRDVHTHDDRYDSTFRKVRGILNKLTPEKFDKLSLELLNVGIDTQIVLKGIILLVFEKALDEPKYSSLYAQLCHRLCEDAPNFEPPSSNITTFRRLLLNKCQDEFENRSKATEVYDKDGPLTSDEGEQLRIAKGKMLGNIKFIGELGKMDMLHPGILHKCIKQLLEKKRHVLLKDCDEDLECLCQILRTVGHRLDTEKARAWMDQYFARIGAYKRNLELPSRIRFMLEDVMELRGNGWRPRKIKIDVGPKTIQQIREDAAKDLGVFIPPSSMQGSRMIPGGGGDLFGHPMNGALGHKGRGGTFGDMFGAHPAELMSIGTGPGVIHVDNYSTGYSTNMGRQRAQQQNQGYQNHQYSNNGRDRQDNSPKQQRRPQNNQQQQQQMQQQQQKNMGGSRDLPPRFMKKPGSDPEISLRPSVNFTMFKPNSPNMLPKSALAGSHSAGFASKGLNSDTTPAVTGPIMSKQPQITIKQAPPSEKSKSNKQKAKPTQEELKQASEALLKEYLQDGEVEQAVTAVKDMRPPNRYLPEFVTFLIKETLDKSDEEQEKVSKLIVALKDENILTSEHYMEALQNVIEKMADLEQDIPLVKSCVSCCAARAVIGGVISLLQLAEPMTGGAHYPLFLLSLQQTHKLKDKQWLVSAFNESKINLETMLPETDRNKERMMEILEDRGLSFMFPLLRVQSELWKQLHAEPNASGLYKWIRDNVDVKLHSTKGFIDILVTSIFRYITNESTLGEGVDPAQVPDKKLAEKEKQLLANFSAVLQRFLHERVNLQVIALYAVQVHLYNNQFPKGMMLRLFMQLYDQEVIEEEAFLQWKEEINDDYPGKGKALFQVNQWLTWLEQAEEESEEEDEE